MPNTTPTDEDLPLGTPWEKRMNGAPGEGVSLTGVLLHESHSCVREAHA